MTSGHSSLEKYTSYFIERVVCERELETEQRLQHIDTPSSSGHSSASFSFSWAAQPRGLGAQPLCWELIPTAWSGTLTSSSELQLIWTSCSRGYIIIWCPPTSCERHDLHSIQPLDSQGLPLISSTGCTCYLHRYISSFDSLAGVNMQHDLARTSIEIQTGP